MRTVVKEKTAAKPMRETSQAKEKPVVRETSIVKETPVRELPQNMGLCSTCNEAPTCVYAKNAKRPVFFCEMFDNSPPPSETVTAAETTAIEQAEMPQPRSAQEKSEPRNLKGLCVNCENREICTFSKPEDGVWHCEEYQ